MSIYSAQPFQLVNDLMSIPFGQDVYVVSDTKYKELQQEQAKKEIATLQNRLISYQAAAERLSDAILSIQTEHDLLPPAPEKPQEMPN